MKVMKYLMTALCLLVATGCTDEDFGVYDDGIQVTASMVHSRTVFKETDGVIDSALICKAIFSGNFINYRHI